MTEKPMESGQDPGAAELPKPQYQEQPVAQQPSAEAKPGATFDIESLMPAIEELVEKKVQSTKDRRIDRMEKQYGDLSELGKMLADVKGGADPKDILDAVERKELLDRIAKLESASQPAPIPGKSEADEAFVKAKDIIKEAGLNNNPRVLEVMSGTYAKPAEMLEKLTLTVLAEVAGKPQATDASKVAPSAPPSGNLGQQAEQDFNSMLESAVTGQIDIDALRAAAEKLEE